MNGDHVAYGVQAGRLVFISEVQRGLACDCTCVQCGRPLVARKGDVRQHHFAHHEATECGGGAETILHLLAKEMFGQFSTLSIPPYRLTLKRKTPSGVTVRKDFAVCRGGAIGIQGVETERLEAGVRPDIVVLSGKKRLLIEIAVTHKVGRGKLRRLRRLNLPAIEIRLSPEDAFLPREKLRAKLQLDLESKFWLFHPEQRHGEREFLASLRSARRAERARPWKAFAPSRQKTISRPRPFHDRSELSPAEYDRRTERFFAEHGRYPTLEECKVLWSP